LQLLAICVTAGSLSGGASQPRSPSNDHATPARAGHPNDLTAALIQLDAENASHVAGRSGYWSDPLTWSSTMAAAGARVVIPRNVTVTVAAPVSAALDWVRIDGRLEFSPDASSELSATTMLVSPSGTLSIGGADHAVDAQQSVQLLFTPRSVTT